jgi:broad specificity phosphatase PhoE
VRRLLLARHAPTAATRRGAFPADEALDEHGRAAATALGGAAPDGCEVLCSPALRCRQTAAAAGLRPQIDVRLAECDFGDWAGCTGAEIDAQRPGEVGGWIADPDARPHGGESLHQFGRRVAGWLDGQCSLDGDALIVTHGGVIRAAVVHALGAPPRAAWQVQVQPLSITELCAEGERWTVWRVNASVGAPAR